MNRMNGRRDDENVCVRWKILSRDVWIHVRLICSGDGYRMQLNNKVLVKFKFI